jgi:hypothetical protein
MAKTKIEWDRDNCVPEIVAKEIASDGDYSGDVRMATFYASLSPKRRESVDWFCMSLCGWTLSTILQGVREHKLPGDVKLLPAKRKENKCSKE